MQGFRLRFVSLMPSGCLVLTSNRLRACLASQNSACLRSFNQGDLFRSPDPVFEAEFDGGEHDILAPRLGDNRWLVECRPGDKTVAATPRNSRSIVSSALHVYTNLGMQDRSLPATSPLLVDATLDKSPLAAIDAVYRAFVAH